MSDAAMKAGENPEASQAGAGTAPLAPALGLFRQFAARARGETPLLTPVLPSRFESALPGSSQEPDAGMLPLESGAARQKPMPSEGFDRSQPKSPGMAQAGNSESTRATAEEKPGEAHRPQPVLADHPKAQGHETMPPRRDFPLPSPTPDWLQSAAGKTNSEAKVASEDLSSVSGKRLLKPSADNPATSTPAKAEAAPWSIPSPGKYRNAERTMEPVVDSFEPEGNESQLGRGQVPASQTGESAKLSVNSPAQPAAAPWAPTRMSPEPASKPGSKSKSTALAGASQETTMAQRIRLTPPARQEGGTPQSRSQGNTQVTQSAAPQVHIRIGRVDFRGVPNAAPVRPAPARPAGPAMDLEGYLRSLDRRTR